MLRQRGELEAARDHLKRALQIFESAYDPDHRDVARTRNDLAALADRLEDAQGVKRSYPE